MSTNWLDQSNHSMAKQWVLSHTPLLAAHQQRRGHLDYQQTVFSTLTGHIHMCIMHKWKGYMLPMLFVHVAFAFIVSVYSCLTDENQKSISTSGNQQNSKSKLARNSVSHGRSCRWSRCSQQRPSQFSLLVGSQLVSALIHAAAFITI